MLKAAGNSLGILFIAVFPAFFTNTTSHEVATKKHVVVQVTSTT